MANCPYCNTTGCYNSGFKVECVNSRCRFYTQKQYELHYAEEIKKVKAAVAASGYKVEPGGENLPPSYKPEMKVVLGPSKGITVTLPQTPQDYSISYTVKKKKPNPDLDRGKDGYPISFQGVLDKDYLDALDKVVKMNFPKTEEETG